MRGFGFSARDHIECLGLNAKLNELHAAMALASLVHIDEQTERNRKLHLLYQQNFENIPGIIIIPYDRTEKRNWRSVLLCLDEGWPFSRDDTLRILNAENVNARVYYSPPLHKTFKNHADGADISLPVAEHIAATHIILPMGTTVFEEDIARMGDLFRDMFRLRDDLRQATGERK